MSLTQTHRHALDGAGERIDGAVYPACLPIVASRTNSSAFRTANPERGGVRRGLGVIRGLGVGLGLGVAVGLAVAVAVGVDVGVEVAVADAVAVGVGVGVAVGVAVGVGVGVPPGTAKAYTLLSPAT